jgi:Uma2 family endonuclease
MTPHYSIEGLKLTYEDLASISDESKRYEILDGDLFVTPSPAIKHQIVSRNLGVLLHAHVRELGLGEVLFAPTDVVLDTHTVVVPDILFVSNARMHVIQPHAIIGAPDLLIEILSPSTADRDRDVKARLYARFGVAHYWVVDAAAHTIDVFEGSGTGNPYAEGRRYAGDAKARIVPFAKLQIDLATLWS